MCTKVTRSKSKSIVETIDLLFESHFREFEGIINQDDFNNYLELKKIAKKKRKKQKK